MKWVIMKVLNGQFFDDKRQPHLDTGRYTEGEVYAWPLDSCVKDLLREHLTEGTYVSPTGSTSEFMKLVDSEEYPEQELAELRKEKTIQEVWRRAMTGRFRVNVAVDNDLLIYDEITGE